MSDGRTRLRWNTTNNESCPTVRQTPISVSASGNCVGHSCPTPVRRSDTRSRKVQQERACGGKTPCRGSDWFASSPAPRRLLEHRGGTGLPKSSLRARGADSWRPDLLNNRGTDGRRGHHAAGNAGSLPRCPRRRAFARRPVGRAVAPRPAPRPGQLAMRVGIAVTRGRAPHRPSRGGAAHAHRDRRGGSTRDLEPPRRSSGAGPTPSPTDTLRRVGHTLARPRRLPGNYPFESQLCVLTPRTAPPETRPRPFRPTPLAGPARRDGPARWSIGRARRGCAGGVPPRGSGVPLSR